MGCALYIFFDSIHRFLTEVPCQGRDEPQRGLPGVLSHPFPQERFQDLGLMMHDKRERPRERVDLAGEIDKHRGEVQITQGKKLVVEETAVLPAVRPEG